MALFDFILDWWERHRISRGRGRPEKPVRPAVAVLPTPPASISASDVFTPTRPRAGKRALVGRETELARIMEAILDENAHVVLYSERGRGKTSLSNLAVESLRRRGGIVARHACDANTDFDSLMRGLLRSLPQSLLAFQQSDGATEGCEAALPPRKLRPADIALVPERLTCPFVIFLVDEFDRVQDLETRTKLADTIKLLSDRAIRLHFMIVGVSATLEQILGQHPSIQRNIVAINLPLLSNDEIALMLNKGGQQAGIQFSEEAQELVIFVARGMPYMAQLLGLRIAQSALRRASPSVSHDDLTAAVRRLLDEAGSGVVAIYNALVGGETPEDMRAVLRRLAIAQQDAWGRMSVSRVGGDLVVGGTRISQNAWSLLLASGVLSQPEGETGAALINDRPLFYHVQLLAARDKLAEAALPAPTPLQARSVA